MSNDIRVAQVIAPVANNGMGDSLWFTAALAPLLPSSELPQAAQDGCAEVRFLQCLSLHLNIDPRGLQSSVAHRRLQVDQVAPLSEVVAGERPPQTVEARRVYLQPLTVLLKLTTRIHILPLPAVPRWEREIEAVPV